MTASTKHRILAIMGILAGVASVATPTWAMPDTPPRLAAFVWQDETVYRPDCPTTNRDHGWSTGGICNDKYCR